MADDRLLPGAWPGYDLPCFACGAGCRPIDRYCSQCGMSEPTRLVDTAVEMTDDELRSPTIVGTIDEQIEQFPQMAPTMLSMLEELDEEPPPPQESTVVLTAEERSTRPSQARSGAKSESRAKSTGGSSSSKARKQKQAERAAALEKLLVPGNLFGRRYRVQRFLGAGAMGYVCSAIDNSIDEVVALKILSAPVQEDPDAFERFKNELKLARKIRHRNVVQSFDLGFADGYPYISMEYIDADNLHKHLARRKTYEEKAALAVVRQVLRGLRAAHDLGIIHRDIKPENILVNKDNLAFITDFGIATTADRVRRREIAGTPDYMAPEQLRCEDVGPPSDLYACGILLYRMLAGSLPFKASSMHEMIEAHLHHDPRPMPDEVKVSQETREMIAWMLQKKMTDRPQVASAVLEQVDFALNRDKTRSASQRLTVLVAEKDAETLSFLRNVLETDGYKVLATSTAREAVNVAFEQQPSVILLDAAIREGFDMVLPDDDTAPGSVPIGGGADGLGFCRIVRADDTLRKVPIVVMSDPSESGLKNAFAQCGAADFLLKPLAPAEITTAVRRVHVAALEAMQEIGESTAW